MNAGFSPLTRVLIRGMVYLSVPALLSLFTFLYFRRVFITPPDASYAKTVIFEIAPDTRFRQIASDLADRGLIRNWWGLNLLARIGGKDTAITAGEYELSRSMGMTDVLRKLISGDVLKRKVTIREGVSIWQIGQLLEDAGVISKAEFDSAIIDRELLITAGIPADSFEGYLFPNTYIFSRPVTIRKVLWTMLEEGEGRWKVEYSDKADKMNLTRHEVLTLASIIEKESGNTEEQPIIASVFYNRLKQNMKLQSDPTVIYGINKFNGNLTKEDLESDTPYNTYVRHGVPPGPICNPGESAIRATLFPSQSPYLFFVSDGKGSHVFSTTLAEHNKWVALYQKSQNGKSAPAVPADPKQESKPSGSSKP